MKLDSKPLEFWQRVKETFDAVWEFEPPSRMKALNQLCPDDEVREEVGQMLIALKAANEFMEKPLIVDPAAFDPNEQVGRCIGPYRLEREIGRGGMGVVYLATRNDGAAQQTVAVKLIGPILAMNEIGWRFGLERLILMRLIHPNIAGLLDSGKTEDGWPYLIMEYVPGSPITEYCDQRRLSIAERLAIFSQACAAVEHAHRNMVIHRDIKPSNILVTEDGSAKLLDFGIAKLIKPDHYSLTLHFTRPGISLMTPEYASPEQVLGGVVTTASDVYSLGVILYELLTGHRPIRFKNPTLGEIVRAIREDEPARPRSVINRVIEETLQDGTWCVTHSPKIVSSMRSASPNQLRESLRGGLDQILFKALHKEVEHRFQSVKELNDDLSRRLSGLPVKAYRRALRYRGGKLLGKHGEAIFVGAFLTLTFVLCWIISLYWP